MSGGPKSLVQRGFRTSAPTLDPGNGNNATGPLFDPSGAQYVHLFGEVFFNDGGGQAQAAMFTGVDDGIALEALNARTRFLAVGGLLYGSRSGTPDTLDRIRSQGTDADGAATQALGILSVAAHNELFNGTTWDRSRSGDATNLSAFSSVGAALMERSGNWSINHVPAVTTQATISRAAGAAGVRHVCTAIDATLIIPPTVNQALIQLNLRDGATGAGTILWSRQFGVGAALANGGQQEVSLSGLNIVGAAATAMTLEFSAAGAATTAQSVALTGYDCQ